MSDLQSSQARKLSLTAEPKTALHCSIQLISGLYFDYEDPWGSDFTIEDIAHGLSHICRYTGHCKDFYSVAEHSVYVSMIVEKQHAKWGLLHDGHESFIGDMARPLKFLCPDYVALEKNIERAVRSRFGLDGTMPAQVKEADMILLQTERQQIMTVTNDDWPCIQGLAPADIEIKCLEPRKAKEMFLQRFYELEAA